MNKDKDMYLPSWVCFLGVGILAFAIICLIFVRLSVPVCIGILFATCLGISAILCHRNQWAIMEDEYSFTYSTMFGHQTRYLFTEIRALKIGKDSFTLVLESGKVHIERCAIMSDRFRNALNDVLKCL